VREFADGAKLEGMPAIQSYGEVADAANLRQAALWAAIAAAANLLLMATSFSPWMITALASGIGTAVFFSLIAANGSIAATRWIAVYMVVMRLLILTSMVAISLLRQGMFTPQFFASMVESILWIAFLVTWLTGQAGSIRRVAVAALLGMVVLLLALGPGLIHNLGTPGSLALRFSAALVALSAVTAIIFLGILAKGPPVSASSPLSGPAPPLPGGASGAA